MHKKRLSRAISTALSGALLAALSQQAQAAGFAIIEENSTDLGSAYSTGAAGNGEASSLYFNPAAITGFKEPRISGGFAYIAPDITFDPSSARNLTLGGIPVSGGDGGDVGVSAVVPNFYYTRPLNAQWHFGFGLSVPFGLESEYDRDWAGRYHAVKSEVVTMNLNPALAFRVNNQLSLGFGLNVQYITGELTTSVDSGGVCIAQTAQLVGLAAAQARCAAAGLTPGNAAVDSYGELTADDWSLGYNLGLLYQITPATRMGFAYRSGIDHKLKGDADFTRSPQFNAFLTAADSTAFSDTSASTTLSLPGTLSVSFAHQVNPALELHGDLSWIEWSRFDKLVITYANPAQPATITTEDWDDTFRIAFGGNYKLNPQWTLRAGLALDQSPVPNEERRTPRIPDADRKWLSLGAGYQVSSRLSVDVGYTHLFFDSASINNTTEGALRYNVQGEYDGSANLLGVQLNYKL